ncbi:MAG: bifunctional glutamate N-acetyltransferase/amino-acid acetyltransferase ArgJ [Anaerolineales bacterium]|nr:bifunctional glutamate N-acetyltransferase/amino-acid acetyltransferase ArgJ [Anaerolineales bacterium]
MKVIKDGTVTTAKGFLAAAATCGIKQSGKPDISLVASATDCTAAGVFTLNQVAAAPVLLDKATLAENQTAVRAVLTNSGNANASTGEPGMVNARQMQAWTAEALGCQANQVLIMSTGVIGQQLPMEKVAVGVKTAVSALSPDSGMAATQAIMTTDLVAKHLAVEVELAGGTVTIGGMAKGSGMIHPNMATMLGVVTTDAAVEATLLQQMLRVANNHSFNRITVDGDTSTNDTVILLANGASGVTIDADNAAAFQAALTHVCTELAKMIVRDGEGASKFVEIQVTGAPSEAAAHAVAQTIATSPLVKTAFAGSDPNWGRILAAAGRAGVTFDQYQTGLWIGVESANELQLVSDGTPTGYAEAAAAAIFAAPSFMIRLDLGRGDAATTMWTTDLTHGYITINADYRT